MLMPQNRFHVAAVLILSLVLSGTFACSRQPAKEPEIRIGAIASVSEDGGESEGTYTYKGASLAVQEINSSGGLDVGGQKYRVVLLFEGFEDVPEEAVVAARKLINQENVIAIVGPQASRNAIPAGKIAESARIPMINPASTNPKTTEGRRYVFRMSFLDDFQGCVMARFAIHELKAGKAAVLYNVADPYSRDIAGVFKGGFENEGGKVVAFESYTTGEEDFTDQIKSIRAQNPDVIFLPNSSRDSALQVQQIKQSGISASLLGSDSWDRKTFRVISEFEGAFMSAHWTFQIDTALNRKFVTDYIQAFGQIPGDTAALTYDAFNMLFEAMKLQRKIDPQSVRDGLYNLGPYQGVSGVIDFIDSGDPVKSAVILRFHEGRTIFHKLVNPEFSTFHETR